MRSILVTGFGSLAVLLIACSTQESICSKEAECLGWNGARQDACEEELEGSDEIASEYDCEEQFAVYMECVDETGTCRVEQKGNSSEHRFDSNCGAQRDALETCEKIARDAPP